MSVDLGLLERWLTGWSLARGVPLPRRDGAGLMVEVGWPDQLRRHVFVDAGRGLQECASRVREPFIYLNAAVNPDQMRRALPADWNIKRAGVSERLLVATEPGRALYLSLGWQVLAPYSTATLAALPSVAAPPSGY